MNEKVNIRRLKTGIPGMDNLLGGGLPEFSFNLIAGIPGSGKTTFAHQMMFNMATADNRALFFTVLGEPPLKMLRYQQQFSFFDFSKVNQSIRFVNLSADLLEGNFKQVLSRIEAEVKDFSPSLVFVDSFRSVAQSSKAMAEGEMELQRFVQQLGVQMTNWQATTFLIGEYLAPEAESSPVFTVADGIIWMTQNLHRNSMVRKIQVVKMRGQAHAPGLHTLRIGGDGIRVFPRAVDPADTAESKEKISRAQQRVSVGVPELDNMLGGGLPQGYALLLVGPSGSGKTILTTEFLAEGVRRGETGVIAAFEKSPSQLLNTKLAGMIDSGQVGVINTRSLDLSIDETLNDLVTMVNKMQAKRLVIDSLSGFELSLAPEFSEDFRGSLYRMIAQLTGMGITIMMTAELEDRYTDLRFSPYGSAFLADAIIVQRYVEIIGQVQRVCSVIKVRGSEHSKDIRSYTITDEGITMGPALSEYAGILTGRPQANAGRESLPLQPGQK